MPERNKTILVEGERVEIIGLSASPNGLFYFGKGGQVYQPNLEVSDVSGEGVHLKGQGKPWPWDSIEQGKLPPCRVDALSIPQEEVIHRQRLMGDKNQ